MRVSVLIFVQLLASVFAKINEPTVREPLEVTIHDRATATYTVYASPVWIKDSGQLRGYITSQQGTNIPVVVGVQFKNGLVTSCEKLPAFDESICYGLTGCVRLHGAFMWFPWNAFWTPFTYAYLTFNTQGHGPTGVYDVPHFDVHFFWTPQEVFKTLTVTGPSPGLLSMEAHNRSLIDPPAKYIIGGGFKVGPPSYGMGQHWGSTQDPVFSGGVFNASFAQGTFDGKTIYFEPVVALSFLKTRQEACWPIPMPQAFEKAGWYPTMYCVRSDPNSDLQAVTLESFQYYPAA